MDDNLFYYLRRISTLAYFSSVSIVGGNWLEESRASQPFCFVADVMQPIMVRVCVAAASLDTGVIWHFP
ncbi:hypothetical protein A2U01_0081387, partial [Trifolium medium]|nr:hypothetical protein [Trifolium medium]